MVRRIATIASVSTLLVVSSATRTSAQDVRGEAEAPAHISFVEGVASLERDGRTDDAPANMPLLAGDRVRTRAGRVEILFADGSTLHLDHNSAIDLQSDELVRLLDGRIRLSIPTRARDVAYRIDGPHAWAHISQPGDYRAAVIQNAGQTELEFAVLRGAAELTNEGGRTTLRAGERAFARANAAPSYAYVFNSVSWDPFDRWSEARRSDRLSLSTQYLPDEVRPYAATLDRYRGVGIRVVLRLCVVPARRLRMASVLPRPVVVALAVRLDVDCRRSVGLADASLRPLGLLDKGIVVLDPRSLMGRGMGLVGARARFCELVPARVQQPAGFSDRERASRLRPVARLDGPVATRFRHWLRSPAGPGRVGDRFADAQLIRAPRHWSGHYGLCRAEGNGGGPHSACRHGRHAPQLVSPADEFG